MTDLDTALHAADMDEVLSLLDAWSKACWASGVRPRADSDNPLEALAHRTAEAIKRGRATRTVRDVPETSVVTLVPAVPTEAQVSAMKKAWRIGNSAMFMKTTDAYRIYFAMLDACEPIGITTEQINLAIAARDKYDEDHLVTCTACGGNGYHHGFGEDGTDPDWCETCGGAAVQFDGDDSGQVRAMLIAAIGD